ncbi:hypothetical protein A3Q56_00224 [Intoshia linei]|uniref:Uncharacterized protein n=1 Tax=Intoshia linei TaxID=1819745 RepID=A0A177BCR5_9BILA|nr:hypothetical protein A3Q56_00224 [Intoshia linei]
MSQKKGSYYDDEMSSNDFYHSSDKDEVDSIENKKLIVTEYEKQPISKPSIIRKDNNISQIDDYTVKINKKVRFENLSEHSCDSDIKDRIINDHLVFSIVSLVFFWPIGIFAIFASLKCKQYIETGVNSLASEYSCKAYHLATKAMIIGSIIFLTILSIISIIILSLRVDY